MIRAHGAGTEPSAGFSEVARRSATKMLVAVSKAASVMPTAGFSQSGQRDGDRYRQ
jgi:hypothetical protein